ncbi:hypothetical protein F383_09745 [Gossypium arboreum]|uniref:Uncharacterized protein n=1 Tax=Gossypium arboreum TaxID=29729 RepID=A0A0B0PCV4_GOSAR|nr:hypothetical protein F383_09745 [Gossypium arboreum]
MPQNSPKCPFPNRIRLGPDRDMPVWDARVQSVK